MQRMSRYPKTLGAAAQSLVLLTLAVSTSIAQVNLVTKQVQVPASMRSAPFDVNRYLNVPEEFDIAVYGRVPNARFLATAPNGDLFISQPDRGTVTVLRPGQESDPQVFTYISGLSRPHDMLFHTIGTVTYLYLSEQDKINRFVYLDGDTKAHDREIVVSGLPGGGNHPLKNFALSPDDLLYVAIASASNADPADRRSNPQRCAIYEYTADGKNGRLFATGIRNAEGVRFVPGTSELWVVVNQRDNIRYPYPDIPDWYGKVIPDYVDNHPPDEFIHVRDGGDYGWPFANPNPDTDNGMDYPPFDPDYENNKDWSLYPPEAFDVATKGIQAHSAPLGLTFLHDTNVLPQFAAGALVGLHGSWNRVKKTGYRVIYFTLDPDTQYLGAEQEFVSGWLDSDTQGVWGRPVATAVSPEGNIYVSDDTSGTVYVLTPAL